MLLVTAVHATSLPPPTQQLTPQPSRLAELLDSLPEDAVNARWELTNIALEALFELYASALRTSMQETPQSPARRSKLSRWQRATRELMANIDNARQRLLMGNNFAIYIDPQSQVIITVEGQLLSLTGLERGDDRRLEQKVVERYCALNVCPFLTTEEGPTNRQALFGRWEIAQDQGPVYVVDDQLGCRFDGLADRHRKAAACQGAARDLRELRGLLAEADRQGQTLDWPLLAASRRDAALGLMLILNRSGTYLTADLPYLARLDQADWQKVIDWLAMPNSDAAQAPLIILGARLLSD